MKVTVTFRDERFQAINCARSGNQTDNDQANKKLNNLRINLTNATSVMNKQTISDVRCLANAANQQLAAKN